MGLVLEGKQNSDVMERDHVGTLLDKGASSGAVGVSEEVIELKKREKV